MTSQGAKFLLVLGSMAVLARLLTPEDFGLIAIATVVIGFTWVFKDMGLSMATVQRADLRHAQASALFWLNVLASLVITVATLAAAPLLAWFYKDPRLTAVTAALAGTILIGGFGIQHQALLRRQMRFGALASSEIASILAGAAAGVLAALGGLGYWSLVVMNVVREIVYAAAGWVLCGWRPGPLARGAGVRPLVSFGAHLTGFNVVNYISRNVQKLLIGWYWGTAPLGLYNNADRILLLPMQQINVPLTGVALPALSRIHEQVDRFRAYYRRGVMLTVTAGMPIVAFLFVSADDAILTFLGPQWLDAVAIFRALGPAAFIGTFNVATGWVYVSLGATRRQFQWGLFAGAVTILGYAIGLPWGPMGVAIAFSAAVVLLRLPSILYCFRATPLRLSDLGSALWRPTVASLAAAGGLYAAQGLVDFTESAGVSLLLDFIIYVSLYIIVWIGLPGGRRSLVEITGIMRELKLSRAGAEDTRVHGAEIT